ncbi:MAG: DUF4384 domain-containing protein [Nitrospirae bacterium]|nr:DUF4384 domain-containing protein [Nitrospirota bacterium]
MITGLRISLVSFILLFFAAAVSGVWAESGNRTRDLFYGNISNEGEVTPPEIAKPTAQKTKPKHIIKPKANGATKLSTGISYWINVVNPDGSVKRSTVESNTFSSGDRIRFAFKTNTDGYIHLLLIGSSGKSKVLFPDKRINKGLNVVQKNVDYEVPSEKAFVFDNTPGEERVLVLFSKRPINDFKKYFEPDKVLKVEDIDKSSADAQSADARKTRTRDLFFEEDAAGSADLKPASYVVNTSGDVNKIISLEIKLKHE